MTQRTALQFRNYRTLPLVFENVIVDRDILPYSEVQLEAAYFDPRFETPRFVNSKECIIEVSEMRNWRCRQYTSGKHITHSWVIICSSTTIRAVTN